MEGRVDEAVELPERIWIDPKAPEPRYFKEYYEPLAEVLVEYVRAPSPVAGVTPADKELLELLGDVDARMQKHVTQWNFGDPEPLPISVAEVGRLVRELQARIAAADSPIPSPQNQNQGEEL